MESTCHLQFTSGEDVFYLYKGENTFHGAGLLVIEKRTGDETVRYYGKFKDAIEINEDGYEFEGSISFGEALYKAKTEGTVVETPVEEPKAEEPTTETPAEEPKAEEPTTETPAIETEDKEVIEKTKDGRAVYTGETVYIVKKGDCLWAIAKQLLGNGKRYNELFTRNGDIVEKANLIFPGQEIIVPSK